MGLLKKVGQALASRAQLVGALSHCPVHQKVESSIPGQGVSLGCESDPWLGLLWGQPIDASLSH